MQIKNKIHLEPQISQTFSLLNMLLPRNWSILISLSLAKIGQKFRTSFQVPKLIFYKALKSWWCSFAVFPSIRSQTATTHRLNLRQHFRGRGIRCNIANWFKSDRSRSLDWISVKPMRHFDVAIFSCKGNYFSFAEITERIYVVLIGSDLFQFFVLASSFVRFIGSWPFGQRQNILKVRLWQLTWRIYRCVVFPPILKDSAIQLGSSLRRNFHVEILCICEKLR